MNRNATIFTAGSNTLIGRAVLRRLKATGFTSFVGLDDNTPDLTDSAAVERFFAENRPEYVVMAAGASGGIEDVVDHRAAGDGVEDLGQSGFHPRTLAGGEDERRQGLARRHGSLRARPGR